MRTRCDRCIHKPELIKSERVKYPRSFPMGIRVQRVRSRQYKLLNRSCEYCYRAGVRAIQSVCMLLYKLGANAGKE